jgi:ABC-2 type transport system ATP-binding protein
VLPSPVASASGPGADTTPKLFRVAATRGVDGAVYPQGINASETFSMVRHAEANPSATWDDGNLVGAGQGRALDRPRTLWGTLSPDQALSRCRFSTTGNCERQRWWNMDAAVTIEQLDKSFGGTRALDGLDLEVKVGEVHGLLGPNGAGKTTTIRVLLGLLRADSGVVRLLGGDPWRDVERLHRRLAYVPGEVTLWPNLTGGEVIDLLGRLRGGLDERRRADLLERFELDPTKKARAYSKGNRQKVALVAALSSDVELLLLDEPTAGLDPLMDAVFRECIVDLRAQGRTALLSSHILSEVEALADRVTIVRDGRTVEVGSLAEMRHLSRVTISADLAAAPHGLDALAGVHNLRVHGNHVDFLADHESLDQVLIALTAVGVTSLTSQPPSLEELFLRHYGDERPATQAEVPASS